MNDRQQAETPKRRRRIGMRITWLLFAVLIMAIAAVVLVAVINVPHEKLPDLLAASRKAAGIGTLLQACLAMWIVLSWRRVVAWCLIKRILRKSEHRKALQMRGKAAGILALYLLLIPIGPMALVRTAQALLH